MLQSTHGGREVLRRRGLARRHGACASATPREGRMRRDVINGVRPNVCYWRGGKVRRGTVCQPVAAAGSGGQASAVERHRHQLVGVVWTTRS